MDTTRSVEMDRLVGQWLTEKQDQNRKGSVVVSYQSAIDAFRIYLNRHGLDLDTQDLDALQQAIEGFRSGGLSRSWKPLSPSSIKWRLDVVHGFYRWAMYHGLQSHSALDFKETKDIDHKVQGFDHRDLVDQLFSIDTSSIQDLRDFLMLTCSIISLMRITEVAAMKVKHLNVETKEMVLGNDLIPLPSKLLDSLVIYVDQVHGKSPNPDDPMWLRMSKITWMEDKTAIGRQTIIFAFQKHLNVWLLKSLNPLVELRKLVLDELTSE